MAGSVAVRAALWSTTPLSQASPPPCQLQVVGAFVLLRPAGLWMIDLTTHLRCMLIRLLPLLAQTLLEHGLLVGPLRRLPLQMLVSFLRNHEPPSS